MQVFLTKTVGLLIILFVFNSYSGAQKLNIDFQIEGYHNDTLIIGYYFGDKTLIEDTLFTQKGKKEYFKWTTDTLVAQGVYFAVLKPDNKIFQFLVNDRPGIIRFKFNAEDLLDLSVKGCKENEAFYSFLLFLGDKRVQRDTLNSSIEKAKMSNLPYEQFNEELAKIDAEVKAFQNRLLKDFPGSILAMLISTNMDIPMPEFTGDAQSVQTQRYYYYKSHYFDNLNFKHPALIRIPTTHQKVDDYLNKMSVQIPDSLMIEVDYILNLAKPNREAFRYFLSEFLNKYGQSKYIGHDGIAAHIIDNYYSKGMAPWVTEENLGKLKDNADNIRPTMLGKKMPDIITYQEDSTAVRLYDIIADYTILFIWDPTCGSCKKAAPDIVNFYNKYKTENIKVLTICNQSGEKYKSCWPSVVEKGMEGLINTGDEYQRYQSKVRNTSVPKIYFLDKDKKILLKDFPSEKLEEIFENFKKNTNNAN